MTEHKENHYGKSEYHYVADLDSRVSEGMSMEERQRREVDFTLGEAELKLDEKSAVLDLACGSGGHAIYINQTTGAEVDARDISAPLIEIARANQIHQHAIGPIRSMVHFSLGDMGNILEAVPTGKRYDLITNFGGSFGFLHRKNAYIRALSEYLGLLKEGGKIAIQLRAFGNTPRTMEQLGVEIRNPHFVEKQSERFAKKMMGLVFRGGDDTAELQDEHILQFEVEKLVDGKMVKCDAIRNTQRGDYFYYTFPNPEIYDASLQPQYDGKGRLIDLLNQSGDSVVVSRRENGRVHGYRDSDGIVINCFNRVYVDPDGEVLDFGANTIDHFAYDAGSIKVLVSFMEEAGFKNIKLTCQKISPNKESFQVVFVGEK